VSRCHAGSLALVVAIALPTPAGAGRFHDLTARGAGAPGRFLGRAAAMFSIPFVHSGGSRVPPAGAAAILRAEDWKTIGFEVSEPTNALYLDVDGSVQFRVAEIVFADGRLERVPLADATRRDGLFALTGWDAERAVMGVRLRVRARSSDAQVGLVLGKDPLPQP
jgi:hypothetical protein